MSGFVFGPGAEVEWQEGGFEARYRQHGVVVARVDGLTRGLITRKTTVQKPDGTKVLIRTRDLSPRGARNAIALTTMRLGRAARLAEDAGHEALYRALRSAVIEFSQQSLTDPDPTALAMAQILLGED